MAVACEEGSNDTEGSTEMVGSAEGEALNVLGWMLTSRRLTILTQVVVPSRIAWTSSGGASTGRPLLPLLFSKPIVTVPPSSVKPLYRNSMDPSTNERAA